MTKRYLESLPEAEQNAILGEVDAEFEAFWATVEAENKRLADEDDREWAEALATETGGEELC